MAFAMRSEGFASSSVHSMPISVPFGDFGSFADFGLFRGDDPIGPDVMLHVLSCDTLARFLRNVRAVAAGTS